MTKMTKLWGALALIFAAGMTWGATPIVYWNGDFDTGSKTGTDGNTYTLTLNGNSVDTDGNLVINSSNGSNKGAYLTVENGNFGRALSVIVKYSGLSVPTGAKNVFAGIKDSSSNKVAVRMSANGAKDLKACVDAGNYNGTAIASLADGSAAREEGYVLFCYNCDSGTAVFTGSSLASLTGGAGTGLRYSTAGITITTLGLGGSAVTSANTNPSWDGLKIEKIAIFKDTSAVSWSNNSGLVTSYFDGFTWPGELPEAAFTYNGATKALTGWLTSWQESGDSAQAIGPAAKGAVALINQDSAGKWHPYGTIAALANDFTWSMYINMDLVGKMPNQQDESNGVASGKGNKRIIIRLGNTTNGLHLIEDNGALKLCKNNDADSTIVIPAANITPGYHLVTITRSSTGGVALYLDDGTVNAKDSSYTTAIDTGFQLGLGCGFKRGYGVAVAQIVGYAEALTPAQVKILSSVYPATTQATGVLTFNGVGKKLFVGNITHTAGRLEVKRGTLYVPADISYNVPAIDFGNTTGSDTFGLELDGALTITGSSSKSNADQSADSVKKCVEGNEGGFVGGDWEGAGTYNVRGTLTIADSYMQPIHDAGMQTYNIENGGKIIVKGIQAGTYHTKTTPQHVFNIKSGGLLKSTEAFSRGKLMANVEAGGVIEIAHTANTDMGSHDMSGITGEGAIKFSGSPWIALPTGENKMFASTLEVINESTNGILLGSNITFTIGPMSGSGALRYDSGASGDGAAGARELCIVQSKDTTWTGNILSQGNSTRELNIHLTSTTGSTFTRTGQCADAKARFTVDAGATLQLEHQNDGNGNIVVLNGGKLTTTGHDDAHGKIIRELSLTANSTFESTSDIFGIGHNNTASKLSLNSNTLTLTAPNNSTRVYLDKTTIVSAGTINVTKGKLFFHCSVPEFSAGSKIIVGENTTIEVAGELKNSHTLSIPELEYNGVLPATTDIPNLTVTSKLSGTGTINKLTLDDGAEVRGQVTVQNEVVLSGTIMLMEEGATLKVPADITGWQEKVLSGVEHMEVAYDSATKTFSLVYSDAAKIGDVYYATLEEAINASLGRPITLLKNAIGPAGCYLINANGHTFSVGAGLSEVHWTRTDGDMYKVTTTADATVGQKRVESNKYDTVAKFDAAAGVNVNALFIPATTTLPKGSKVTIQSIGLSYRNSGYPESITLAGTTSSSMSNTGTGTVRVGADNGGVRWVRYAFDDVEVTVGEEIAISAGTTFDTYFTAVAETDTTALRKEQFKTTETLIYEIQYTVTTIASPNVVTVTINGVTTGYPTIDAAIEAAAAAEGAVITLADATADAPAGFVKGENGVLTAAKYIVISPSSYVSNWQTYVGARAESPVATGITFGVKNASEIYAAYPANASADDGTPRNDAESLHKWIGLMQKLGTKYFVLGSRWKGIDTSSKTYNPQTDRATIIPGIAVYPKLPKADASPLDIVSSDLFYACHYKADGQKYVWDPSNDGVYVGLMETAADQMDDVRHFQPNCVVSRMDLYGNLKNTTARNYQECIADYQMKIVKAETQAFSGDDRYVAWTAQCKRFDASGLPDVYGVMSARLNSINTARGAKELLHLIYLGIEPTEENGYQTQAMSDELLAENKASLLNGNWEVFLPFGHGTPDGFAGLDTEAFGTNSGLAKFFMGNIPCLTGSQTAECNAASAALANPNGGALVSVNNSSYGYLTEAGITERYSGLSDELADHCLDTYVGGATAGESWRNAISVFAGKVLSTEGFKNDALVARGHDGCSTVTLHSGKANEVELTVPDKNYVIAAMIEENLFGDPLVKIQTTSKTTSIAATASRSARDYGVCADEFTSTALAEFNKDDSKSLTVTGACTTESAITVPEGKTLEVLNETTLTSTHEDGVTVNGTLVGAGTVNAAITFGANSTLDVSRLAKLTIPAGKDVTLPQAGINFIVPEGTTKIPAVLSLLVCNRADEGDHRALVKSVTAKGSESALTPCGSAAFKLEALHGKIYLVDEGNMIEVPHFLTDLGATVATITIEDKEGNKRELELARDPKNPEVILDHYLVPAGSNVVITVQPDAEHTGKKATATVNSAADITTIISALQSQIPNQKYTGTRAASTVFYNAGTGVEYSGAMANKVVNAEGHNSQILDGDTVVFDRNHAVPIDIVVGADPKGAKLVFEKDVTLTTEQPTTLFTGKAFEIHADHVLTFMPGTREGFKLGNCTMDKGTAAFAAGGQNNENNIFYLDSIVGTTLLDFRPEVEIRSLNSDNWIHFHTRVTGGATVTGNVRILGDARVIVKRSEYITVTGDVTAQVVDADGNPVAGEYHRLTIDAIDAMVEWWDDNGTPRLKPVNLLKLKDKATADAIVGRINLIAPEVKDENGELILWQLDTLNDGMIVMTRLEYDVRDGFFMNGILGKDEYADWKYNSAFDQSVTKIQATCPAELKFDFTGAAEGAVITVDKPIELSGTGKLTFDVPEGKTVIVTGTISGTEGVRKSGKGTLIFGGTADNTFEGSLVVSEGAVRTTKAHGYSKHRTLSDGTDENPEIDVHTGATLDLGNVCDLDNLTIISAGTITNSVHGATQIGKIKTLTLKGDTTVCGHTFGMAKDSKIVLEGHKLTIAMERGECVTTPKPDGTGTEVHDHEFELNNTQVSGGKDNLDDPDIIVVQGTLSCEGSTYVDRVFTKGVNNLGNASLKICKDAAIRLDTDLIVKRIQIVDAMKKVVVPCHEFEKIWEESIDGVHYAKIIIRQELVGGIKAPRLQLGLDSDTSKMLYDVGNNMNSPEIRRIRLGDGEYIDCTEEFIFGIGYPFNAFFEDWTGEAGARRLFHGWSKFADGYSSAEIINPWAVKFTSQDHSKYELTVCDWYPYGSYGFRDVPCACVNTIPLEDQDWAYVLALWPLGEKQFEFANVLMTTITHMDENPIYTWNDKTQKFDLDTDVLKTNNVLCPVCQRGDGSMDFVIAEDWLKQYMGDAYTAYLSEYAWSEAGGNGTISRWINETGANGIERWQSYMLGLNPNNAESLPVLAVRTDTAPSVQKDGKTFVNVKVGGIAPRGYQYISPIYQVEEVSINPTTGKITAGTKTDWQADPSFEVEVPVKSQAKDATPDHVKYFRVNVSFEGSDGMNNK